LLISDSASRVAAMPLTKCPECDKDISTAATACPHCGHPTGVTTMSPAKIARSALMITLLTVAGIGIGILICVGIAVGYLNQLFAPLR
jgi:hypothetical protein